MSGKILRITESSSTGSITKIYKRTWFGWKKIIQYRRILVRGRTIGLLEPHLGLPSVMTLYGGPTSGYIFKRDL